jgi:hypothetical protein
VDKELIDIAYYINVTKFSVSYLHCFHLVSFTACVVLCAGFCLSVMCVTCVLCLTVVKLPPG